MEWLKLHVGAYDHGIQVAAFGPEPFQDLDTYVAMAAELDSPPPDEEVGVVGHVMVVPLLLP